MHETPVIQFKNLGKQYVANGPFALRKLTIEVTKGEVYGFLGPNGAGKSTTIRLLLNFIQPTEGTATILGNDIVTDSVKLREHIGYLSGDFRAYSKLTGKEFLAYMCDLRPPKRAGYRLELASRFKLDLNKRISDLSKGNRQKLGIIQAFMHEPEVLILDEPTDGLDPLMQETFYALVREHRDKGATAFVSSHNLPEVRKMCDRVGIIRGGELVSQSTIAELAEEAAQTFYVSFKGKPPVSELKKLSGTKVVHHKDNEVSLHVHGELGPLLTLLSRAHVASLSTRELDLEEEFMRFYQTEKKS